MDKRVIILITIIIIIIGIISAFWIFNNRKENENNLEIVRKEEISEGVTDECTEEWEELQKRFKNNIEVNSSEEKISPNAYIILKKYYKDCGHTINKYLDISEEIVNKTKNEVEEIYPEWDVKNFRPNELVLYKEFEGECGEHFIIRENEGKIAIYKLDENKNESLYEETKISTQYLTENDKMDIKRGITINSKEELNQFIENFE